MDNYKVDFYQDTLTIKHKYLLVDNQLHSESKPALLSYRPNGSLIYEMYYINGKSHRLDGPAVTCYNEDGSIKYISYYINNENHREDGPAVIYYSNGPSLNERYYFHDELITDQYIIDNWSDFCKIQLFR